MPRLPRIYTIVDEDGWVFWRGVNTTGGGADYNLGAVRVYTEAEARKTYLRRLKIEAGRRRRLREQFAILEAQGRGVSKEAFYDAVGSSSDRLRAIGDHVAPPGRVRRGPYRHVVRRSKTR